MEINKGRVQKSPSLSHPNSLWIDAVVLDLQKVVHSRTSNCPLASGRVDGAEAFAGALEQRRVFRAIRVTFDEEAVGFRFGPTVKGAAHQDLQGRTTAELQTLLFVPGKRRLGERKVGRSER